MGKEDKQFPLNDKENCRVYLCRIISSCELCMDQFKIYNKQLQDTLEEYKEKELVPFQVYTELKDKIYCVSGYLVNLLGDCQTSAISYFKYRKYVKRAKDIPTLKLPEEIEDILSELNKSRNWENHVPESLLVAEMELVEKKELVFPMDPVVITHYENVTFKYVESLYRTSLAFYKNARKVIQYAKKEYSMLMGKTILYPRVYSDKPLCEEKHKACIMSAKVQGLHGWSGE